jgi:hypothetical protein
MPWWTAALVLLAGCLRGPPLSHADPQPIGDRRVQLACPRRDVTQPASRAAAAPNRMVWIRTIEDRRPLARIRSPVPPVPRRSIVGRTACAEGGDTCWLILAEGSLIGRVDTDLMQLLDEAGYVVPAERVPAAAPVWLEVLIEELWVGDEVTSGEEVATVVLILTLVDPRTERVRWSGAFDVEEVELQPRDAQRGERTLRAAYCRVLEQIAEALRGSDFAAAVADVEP